MTEIGATDCPASPIGLRRSCLPQPLSRAAKMAVGPVATGAFGGRNGAEAGVVSGGRGMEAIIQINHETVRRREARFAAAGPRRWHIAAARNIRVRYVTSPRARDEDHRRRRLGCHVGRIVTGAGNHLQRRKAKPFRLLPDYLAQRRIKHDRRLAPDHGKLCPRREALDLVRQVRLLRQGRSLRDGACRFRGGLPGSSLTIRYADKQPTLSPPARLHAPWPMC